MKIIITIIILGILLLVFVGAVSLGIIKTDFTKEVLKIDTIKICEAELLSNIFNKKCDKNTPSEINISSSMISIIKNPKTGAIKVQSK